MKKKIPENILNKIDEHQHDEINEIWELIQQSQTKEAEISQQDIENALDDVHTRLRMEGEWSSAADNIAEWIQQHARYLVAAVALIAATTIFFLVPKTVVVSYGEMATLQLPDGTEIEMNSGSAIRYSRLYRFTDRTIELNGEAYFTVENHAHPFIVETNGAVVEVTGTQFNVRSWGDEPVNETLVTVTEGDVLIYPVRNKDEQLHLTAGESSYWSPGLSKPSRRETLNTDDIIAWRDQRFVFQNRTFVSILKELERRFNTVIELEAEGVESSALTAYYSNNIRLESILDDICTVKGLRYTQTTNGYRIFR